MGALRLMTNVGAVYDRAQFAETEVVRGHRPRLQFSFATSDQIHRHLTAARRKAISSLEGTPVQCLSGEVVNMRAGYRTRSCARTGIVGGLIIMVLGVAFLLMNFGLLATDVVRWWPLLLIVIGISKLLPWGWAHDRRRPNGDFGPGENRG